MNGFLPFRQEKRKRGSKELRVRWPKIVQENFAYTALEVYPTGVYPWLKC